MALEAPKPLVDVQDFLFKAQGKIRVFSSSDDVPKGPSSLLSAASRYGLVFVGCPSGHLRVLQLSTIVRCSGSDIQNAPMRSHQLISTPRHVSVNCDSTILAVTIEKDGAHIVQFYDVLSFFRQSIQLVQEIRLTNTLCQLAWNPCVPGVLAVTLMDGSVCVFEVKKTSVDINSVDGSINAMSICWSPKGKQLVVGTARHTLTQFKPDLKPVKSINFPQVSGAIVAVQWLSNYQFVAAVADSANTNNPPSIVVINAPKTGPVTCINYEDICYSTSEEHSHQVFLIYQGVWSILLAASANSSEVGVLGGTPQQDIHIWRQWMLIDEGRAEMPSHAGNQETFPIGIVLDTGTTHQIRIGDNNQLLPPMPMLHILSDKGVLVSFNVINTIPNIAPICSPPETVKDNSGLSAFVEQDFNELSKIETKQHSTHIPRLIQSDSTKPASPPNATFQENQPFSGTGDVSFMLNKTAVTSTPAKPASLFGVQKSPPVNLFGGWGAGTQQPAFTAPPVSTANSELPAFGSLGFGNTQITSTNTNTGLFGAGNKFTAAVPVSTAAPISKPLNLQSQVITTLQDSKQTDLPKPLPSYPTTASSNIQQTVENAVPIQPFSPPNDQSDCGTVQIQPVEYLEPELSQEDQEALTKLINEEIELFQYDLKQLMKRSKDINIQIGSEDESQVLYSEIENLKAFLQEAKDSTQNQTSEVQSVKQTLVESFSWLSEAKSKCAQESALGSGLTSFKQLQRSAALDQVSRRQLSTITKSLYYVDSQITQLNRQIDSQWSEFQDSCRAQAKGRMHIPSMESIYQALVKQGDILARQKALVKELLTRTNKNSIHVEKSSTHNNNMTNLTNAFVSLNFSNQSFANEAQIERIQYFQQRFTPCKQDALRAALHNHTSVRTVPVHIDVPGVRSSIVLERLDKLKSKQKHLVPSATYQTTPRDNKSSNLSSRQLSQTKASAIAKNLSDYYENNTLPTTPAGQVKDKTLKRLNAPDQIVQPNIVESTKAGQTDQKPQDIFSFGSSKPSFTTTLPSFSLGSSGDSIQKGNSNLFGSSFNFSATKPPQTGQTTTGTVVPMKPAVTSASLLTSPPGTGDAGDSPLNSLSGFVFGMNDKSKPFTPSLQTTSSPLEKPTPLKFNFTPPAPDPVKESTVSANIFGGTGLAQDTFSFSKSLAQKSTTSTFSFGSPSGITLKTTESVPPKVDVSEKLKSHSKVSASFGGADNKFGDNRSELEQYLPDLKTVTSSASDTQISFSNKDIVVSNTSTVVDTTAFKRPSEQETTTASSMEKKNSTEKPQTFSFSLSPITEKKPSISIAPAITTTTMGTSSVSSAFINVTNTTTTVTSTTSKPAESTFTFKLDDNKDGATANPATSFGGLSLSTDNKSGGDAPKASNIFGGTGFGGGAPATSPTPAIGGSLFGSSAFAPPAQAFGSPPTQSIFGSASQSPPKFGNTGQTDQARSLFGAPRENPFSASVPSAFGAPAKPEGTSMFGAPTSPSDNLGSNTFGGVQTGTSIFGNASALKPATGMFGAFGATPSIGGSSFGGTANTGATFGSTGNTFGSGFGSSAPSGFGTGGPAFGQGAFSSGGTSVNQGGFGSPTGFNKSPASTGGFGAPSTLGGFGSSPTFGGAPAFGSPTKTFGAPSPVAGFGSPTHQSSTFENLAANTNTMTFGNLAQGGLPAQNKPTAFTGSPSFSSWR